MSKGRGNNLKGKKSGMNSKKRTRSEKEDAGPKEVDKIQSLMIKRCLKRSVDQDPSKKMDGGESRDLKITGTRPGKGEYQAS